MKREDFLLNIRKVFAGHKGTKEEHVTLEAMAKYLEKMLPDPLIPEDIKKEVEVPRKAEEE